MAPYTAEQIADTIIHLSRESGMNDMTNLKLQKLLYYAQAWHLAFTGEPLFDDSIQAWVHGPVVPSVFRKFKSYRWGVIDCPVNPICDTQVVEHLKSVLAAYGKFHAWQLERLTHSEAPWADARHGLPVDEASQNVIEFTAMRDYYLKLSQANR